MAILLPAGIFLGWLVIPNPLPVKSVAVSPQDGLPVIVSKKETKQYCIDLRTNNEKSQWQIEWKNKVPLTTPSAVIYLLPERSNRNSFPEEFNTMDAEQIGRIEAQGNYQFTFRPNSSSPGDLKFLVYDFIHEKVFDTITFAALPGSIPKN
jgi:hypothetical protein